VVERSPERNENVDAKHQVNQGVEEGELGARERFGFKTQFKRDEKAVVEGEHNHEQLPVGLAGVVLRNHKSRVLVAGVSSERPEKILDALQVPCHFALDLGCSLGLDLLLLLLVLPIVHLYVFKESQSAIILMYVVIVTHQHAPFVVVVLGLSVFFVFLLIALGLGQVDRLQWLRWRHLERKRLVLHHGCLLYVGLLFHNWLFALAGIRQGLTSHLLRLIRSFTFVGTRLGLKL
jgi:hypothetical protein